LMSDPRDKYAFCGSDLLLIGEIMNKIICVSSHVLLLCDCSINKNWYYVI
jgi:hypothetical protein